METRKEALDDSWTDLLSYKIKDERASYVTARKSSTWHPLGPQDYSSGRLIKLTIASYDVIDPSTLRLFLQLLIFHQIHKIYLV